MNPSDSTTTEGDVRILRVGDGWTAVGKPAGMSVHNDPGRDLCARVSAFFSTRPDVARAAGWRVEFGVHPVHRLDRNTSGVVLLALRRGCLRELSGIMAAGRVKKRYLALVHGCLEALPAKTFFQWRWPLSRRAAGRADPSGPKPRTACVTEVRVLESSLRYTLLEARPVTGRRHQIRRHAKLAGHPVVGDGRYASKRALRFLWNNGFRRMALHAASLEFVPPGETSTLVVGDDALPQEIRRLLDDPR